MPATSTASAPSTLGVGLPRGLAAAGCVLAGAAASAGFEPLALWPVQLVGVALLTVLVRGARLRTGFARGYLFGLAFLALSVGWIHVLGWPVAVALVAFEALFFAVLGLGLAAVGRLPAWPVWAAAVWTFVEFCYSRIPFGGFGWSRLGYAAVDSPLAGLFPFVGVAGVGFCSALVAQGLAWLALSARGLRVRRVLPVVLVGVLLFTAGLAGRSWTPADQPTGSVTVGYVQGNVDGVGIEAMGRARTVTNNHLSETITLMARARAGVTPMPDFVLWPENSTDIDPTLDAPTEQTVRLSVLLADRPIFVGAVMEGPGVDERQTSGVWWDPARGVTARYDKRNLVPFGEYIPFRDVLLPRIPILRLVGAQSVPGTVPGVLDVDVAGRPVAVGDLICFELAYDDTVRQMIRGGAEVVTVQSNNATYAGTAQIAQQFAITRVRAMETRREIVVATTNALSGHVDSFGHVTAETTQRTAASGVVAMPERHAVTPAMRWGLGVDVALSALGALALLAGITARFGIASRSGIAARFRGRSGSRHFAS